MQSEAWEDMWAERFRCTPKSIWEDMVHSVQLRIADDEDTHEDTNVPA